MLPGLLVTAQHQSSSFLFYQTAFEWDEQAVAQPHLYILVHPPHWEPHWYHCRRRYQILLDLLVQQHRQLDGRTAPRHRFQCPTQLWDWSVSTADDRRKGRSEWVSVSEAAEEMMRQYVWVQIESIIREDQVKASVSVTDASCKLPDSNGTTLCISSHRLCRKERENKRNEHVYEHEQDAKHSK